MKKIRKFAAAAAITAMAVASLVGCAGSGGTGGDHITLSFWTHTHPPMIAVFKDLITKYEAANPNITIDYQQIPNTEFATKMLTSLSNGSGPDLINMDDASLRGDYIPKGLISPIDTAAVGAKSASDLESRYVPGTLAGAAGDDGTLYGLPIEFNGTALAINVQHFKDAGLDPNAPLTTWDDVITAGQKLIAAGHTQAFSFLYLHAGWVSQELQTLLTQTGGSVVDGDKGALDSPESQAALQLWVNLATGPDALGDPNAVNQDATVPFQDVATGKQSIAIMYPWAMDQIKETNPDTYANLKVIPLPQLDPAHPASRVYGNYLAVNSASKQQVEAWKFANFLTQFPDEWITDSSFVQPLVGWDKTDAARKIPFIDVWSQAYSTGKFDQIPQHYTEITDAMTKMVNDSVFDGVSVKDSSKEASDAVTRILQG
jgi:ABC-type glycerol-3-phosphate transport system substrate-binding protein